SRDRIGHASAMMPSRYPSATSYRRQDATPIWEEVVAAPVAGRTEKVASKAPFAAFRMRNSSPGLSQGLVVARPEPRPRKHNVSTPLAFTTNISTASTALLAVHETSPTMP